MGWVPTGEEEKDPGSVATTSEGAGVGVSSVTVDTYVRQGGVVVGVVVVATAKTESNTESSMRSTLVPVVTSGSLQYWT